MGPLAGIRIIEMAGIGPGPFACMLLADMGAEVIRIDRPGALDLSGNPGDIVGRGRRSIAINLKQQQGVEMVLQLVTSADALIEGFRPGVMEKLGLGPEVCLKRNAKLVYGRMTGWGQDGPLSQAAGHDINYIAITGALDAIGRKDSGPVPPLNLVGDYAGGSSYLVMGLLAALLETKSSGQGQVVDVAISDGVISLMSAIYGFKASGMWEGGRAKNFLDGGAHFYDTYECSDGRWISVGSIEPQFYALLVEKLGLKSADGESEETSYAAQLDRSRWPVLKEKITAMIKTKTQAQWCELMEGTDVCFGPVLSMDEAPNHPHNVARKAFFERDSVMQPAPAPKFSRTTSEAGRTSVAAGADSREILRELGLQETAIDELFKQDVVK
jgi:alpha-methylacyl-CoA racemase